MGRAVKTESRAILVLAVALVAAGSLLALLATSPAEAASRYKTVTKTFSNPTAIQVPHPSVTTREGPASPYPAEISIGGLKGGRILDVNLKINGYGHTCLEDVDALLVGPRGQNVVAMSDVPSCGSGTGINLTLDDEGAGSWPVPLTSGTYRPADNDAPGIDMFPAPAGGSEPPQNGGSALSAFDATNPNGAWKLYVMDDTLGSAGQFAGGWSLTIKAKVRR